jgi:hypothetical protein
MIFGEKQYLLKINAKQIVLLNAIGFPARIKAQ